MNQNNPYLSPEGNPDGRLGKAWEHGRAGLPPKCTWALSGREKSYVGIAYLEGKKIFDQNHTPIRKREP